MSTRKFILSSTEMDEVEVAIEFLDNRTTPVQNVQKQSFASFTRIPSLGGVYGKLNFVLAERHYGASDKC